MGRFRVVFRSKRSAPWEVCYIVDRKPYRQSALDSAREIFNQENELGTSGQIGIQAEEGGKVTILR
jgi:hypothetical protein